MFGIQVVERQRIGNPIGVESLPLISDDDGHSLSAFAAATNVNQLASVCAIAVEHRVAQCFPKREFNYNKSSFPPAQRDPAIKPMSQSTSGEIRPLSLRTQVCSSRGAFVKSGLRTTDSSDLKLPTQVISVASHLARSLSQDLGQSATDKWSSASDNRAVIRYKENRCLRDLLRSLL